MRLHTAHQRRKRIERRRIRRAEAMRIAEELRRTLSFGVYRLRLLFSRHDDACSNVERIEGP